MTEETGNRQSNSDLIRKEYDTSRTADLREAAVEGVDELLDFSGSLSTHEYVDGVSTRALEFFYTENDDSDYRVLFSDLSSVMLMRHPVQAEVHVSTKEYRNGPLRRLSMLIVRQYIANSTAFQQEYCLETYVGGAIQATTSSTDVINGEGLDVRTMTPYDFYGLVQGITKAERYIAHARATISVVETEAND